MLRVCSSGSGQQRIFAGFDKSLGGVCDGNDFSIQLHHVNDRRADDRQFGRHILECFGGADKARGFVQHERQQTHVPAGQKLWERFIGLLPQIMDVMAPRQCGRVDFHHWPHQNDLPSRVRVSQAIDKLKIYSLINHSIVAEPWTGDIFVRRVDIVAIEGLLEVHEVNAAGKAMHVGMALPLCTIKARAAGKHQIGCLEQRILALEHLLRRVLESGQLVHAIVHNQRGVQFLQQRQCHRRIKPRYMRLVVRHELPHQFYQMRQLLIMKTRGSDGRIGFQNRDVRRRSGSFEEAVMLVESRFLNEQNLVVFSHPGQQVLWPLIHEVPTEVRKNNNGGIVAP